MKYEQWDDYEPASIRRAVPLEWAAGYLFGAWGMGADMEACPLPDHQDDTPSANLWAADSDGFPQRFGCFGCGVNEDVVGLIRIARGVGFLEACRIAVEELAPALAASGWTPTERVPVDRAAKSHDELLGVVRRLRYSTDADADLVTFIARKFGGSAPDGELPPDFTDYVVREWRWGTFRTPAPAVFFPHAGWDRRLTGIRYRSVRRDGTRWTERDSRFPALYGAWRAEHRQRVVLCEGETDTVWAAWQLRHRAFDVFGLAAGAAQKPPEEAVARLRRRKVYLAFDADMAGRIASARWREALGDDVLVAPIPEGEDVLSCGVPVAELIAAAE